MSSRKIRSGVAIAVAAVSLMFAGVPGATAAPAPSAAVAATRACGFTWEYYSPTPTTSQTAKKLYYRNCSSVAVRMKPDISLGIDGECKVVTPYATQTWTWLRTGLDSVRGMKSC